MSETPLDLAPGPRRASAGTRAYLDKAGSYFAGVRADFVDELPDAAEAAILEIGCAEGGTGALALARGKCARYVGIELHAPSARVAGTRLSEVHVGDVERMALPFAPESFDALVASEVLEHLVDPWAALGRLVPLLRPGGMVLASSPNISHHRVVRDLIAGRFELTDRGAMDRTHLRWFTPRSYAALFEGAGLVVEAVRPVTPPGWRRRLVDRLSGGRLSHLFMAQICVRARRPD